MWSNWHVLLFYSNILYLTSLTIWFQCGQSAMSNYLRHVQFSISMWSIWWVWLFEAHIICPTSLAIWFRHVELDQSNESNMSNYFDFNMISNMLYPTHQRHEAILVACVIYIYWFYRTYCDLDSYGIHSAKYWSFFRSVSDPLATFVDIFQSFLPYLVCSFTIFVTLRYFWLPKVSTFTWLLFFYPNWFRHRSDFALIFL